ncbi:MAG: cell division protein FtsH, partial [Verrucomicrobia bacterium]|nr:cell division protein FtsH [Verrucomicrobiota bacterium]
ELTRAQNYSEETARKVDAAIKDIIDVQYLRAVGILTERRTALDKIAAALLEYETIEGKHVHEILELGEIRSPITKDVPPEDTDEVEGEEQSQEKTAKDDDVGDIEPGSEPTVVPA